MSLLRAAELSSSKVMQAIASTVASQASTLSTQASTISGAVSAIGEIDQAVDAIPASNIGKVYDSNSETWQNVWIGTQAAYDAIVAPDVTTIYLIEEAE